MRAGELQGFETPPDRASLGTRVHVWGNSCAGKSTFARALGERLGLPVVELDALNWRAGWIALQDTDPRRFESAIEAACRGDGWVVEGSYGRTSLELVWPRVHTVIWLDLPRRRLVWRVLCRSAYRAWTRELLWGEVRERFWPQLMVWRREQSLLWWIWTQHARKRRQMCAWAVDARFRHVQFVRFGSTREANVWLAGLNITVH